MRLSHPIRKVALICAAIVALSIATIAPASAVAAKFHDATASVNNDGSLTVSFDERGLGDGDINYVLTADASATFACINGGNKHPQAANKETINSQVSAAGTFQSKNGRVIASLTTTAPTSGDFACPSGQRLVLASVSYSNIVLTDTTNSSTTSVADVTRVFFAV